MTVLLRYTNYLVFSPLTNTRGIKSTRKPIFNSTNRRTPIPSNIIPIITFHRHQDTIPTMLRAQSIIIPIVANFTLLTAPKILTKITVLSTLIALFQIFPHKSAWLTKITSPFLFLVPITTFSDTDILTVFHIACFADALPVVILLLVWVLALSIVKDLYTSTELHKGDTTIIPHKKARSTITTLPMSRQSHIE